MNIKQSIKDHPRRAGGCCLALMGVTLILVIITITSSRGNTKTRILYQAYIKFIDVLTDPLLKQTEADNITITVPRGHTELNLASKMLN